MRKCLSVLGLLVCISLVGNLDAQVCDSLSSVAVFSFEDCQAENPSAQMDYSDLRAAINSPSSCSSLSVSNVYRNDPVNNPHSCAPGREDAIALCISPLDNCQFVENSDKALRFEVELTPGLSGVAQLSQIDFYQKAPPIFRWINGAQGLNKYPRKYAIRVLRDTTEIYREIDINTSSNWSKQSYNFTDDYNFRVFENTTFHIEILPYCLSSTESTVSVWDIDDLSIYSCCIECPSLAGGALSSSTSKLCIGNGSSSIVELSLSGESGPNSAYIITDEAGNVTDFPLQPPFDFSDANSGICNIWHLSYEEDLTLTIGGPLNLAQGCYNLSNPITIEKKRVDGGALSTDEGEDVVIVCNGDGNPALVDFILLNNEGDSSSIIVTDLIGNIIDIPSTLPIDFEGTGYGTCDVWNISFADEIENLEIGNNVSDLVGCFDLSNPVSVIRNGVNGGIVTINGESEPCILPEQMSNVDVELSGIVGQRVKWLITDLNGEIILTPHKPPFDFSSLSNGQFQIYHVSHTGELVGANLGENIQDLDGCFDLSTPATITKLDLNAGEISTGDPLNTCQGDGAADLVNVSVSGNSSSLFSWIITDETGEIIALQSNSVFDFEPAGPGTCFIYYLAYESGIENLDEGLLISDIRGCFELSNSLQVNRTEVNGGEISTESDTDLCVGDGNDDFIEVNLSGNVGANSQWVITDQNGLILNLPTSPPFNFENTTSGTCLIWHLSFENGLIGAEVGLSANEMTGCFNLSNPIQVNRTEVSGGTISTSDITELCVGDGNSDFINVDLTGNIGSNSSWLITTEGGEILDVGSTPPFNFESTEEGVCLIWHLSYEDEIEGLSTGSSASDLIGCFALSNSIRVVRNEVNGGVITTEDPTTICSGDGQADITNFSVTNRTGTRLRWVVTDDEGVILEISPDGVFNFEGAESGSCFVYHISYEAGIFGFISGRNIDDLAGCFDLSNSIEIIRERVDGGEISTDDNTSLCIPLGSSVTISSEVIGEEGSNSNWLMTSNSGEILAINTSGTFDFAMTGSGSSFIWHVSYESGISGLAVGNNASDIRGCFDLSNNIPVSVERVNGGQISTQNDTNICSGDGNSDLVEVSVTGNSGSRSLWLITDPSGQILDVSISNVFDFDNAGLGTCFIWHLSYEGDLEGAEMGLDADDIEGCFHLSNSIRIDREEVQGGNISTDDSTVICSGDDLADPIQFQLTGNAGANQRWVITDEDLNILDITQSNIVDFEPAGGGICLVWSINYQNGISGLSTGSNAADLIGCYALSNPISIIREEVAGGLISTQDDTNICSGDGVSNIVNVSLSGEIGDNGTWLVTDINGLILDRQSNSRFDFEGVPTGECLIWHLSYEDGAVGFGIGDNAYDISGCHDLSNSISVFRDFVHGGELSTQDNTLVCSGDGVDDFISVTLTGNAGDSQAWIITDDQGQILDLPASSPFNFEGVPSGVCLIYHLSYNGSISGLTTGQNINNLAGCLNISNGITIIRNEVAGGIITTNDETELCLSDGLNELINIELSNEAGQNSRFIITDTDLNILGLQSNPTFDFENAGAGNCLIWHIGYEDGISGLSNGRNVSDLVGCFDISNSIEITRHSAVAGIIRTFDNTDICVDDGIEELISVQVEGNVSESEAWIIADGNGDILDLPNAGPFDFEGAGPGICYIYHLSYSSSISGLTIGQNISDIAGCFGLSNSIEVVRNIADGGMIQLVTGGISTNICIGDCVLDTIDVFVIGNVGSVNEWLVTDDLGNILAYPAMPPFDFEAAGAGTCQIYHISYEGLISGLNVGSNLNDLTGCFGLSNAVTVFRNTVEGEGTSTLNFDMEDCDARLMGDFEQDYSEFIPQINNQTDCAQLALESASLYRDNPTERYHSCTEGVNGGVAVCVGSLDQCSFEDGSEYALKVSISITPGISGLGILSGIEFYSRAPEEYQFVNGDSGVNNYPTLFGLRVLKEGQEVFSSVDIPTTKDYFLESFDFSAIADFQVTETTIFDFEFLAYCLADNGGDETAWDIDELNFISDCNNKIDAGAVSLQNGVTRIELCTDDGDSDDVEFFTSSSFTPYLYVITADDNRIVATATGNSFDFEGGLQGNCRVWGVAYSGTFNASIGDNILEASLSNGCWVVSSNFITIERLNGTDCPSSRPIAAQSDLIARLAPNPSTDYITVEMDEFEDHECSIVLFDLEGNRLKTYEYSPNKAANFKIDISQLNQGSYFLKIMNKGRFKTGQFIKIE